MMKIMKLKSVAVLLVSALCLSTITACSKSDQAADDVAAIRKIKEKEVADKAAGDARSVAEQARAREAMKQPLP